MALSSLQLDPEWYIEYTDNKNECVEVFKFTIRPKAPSNKPSMPVAENVTVTTEPSMEVVENVTVTTEPSMPVVENVAVTTEPTMQVAENIAVATEPSKQFAKNETVTTEISMQVVDSATVMFEPSMQVAENVTVTTEPSMEVVENVTVTTEPSMPVTENVAVTSEPTMQVAENIAVATEPSKQFAENDTETTEPSMEVVENMAVTTESSTRKQISTDLVVVLDHMVNQESKQAMDDATVSIEPVTTFHLAVVKDNQLELSDSDRYTENKRLCEYYNFRPPISPKSFKKIKWRYLTTVAADLRPGYKFKTLEELSLIPRKFSEPFCRPGPVALCRNHHWYLVDSIVQEVYLRSDESPFYVVRWRAYEDELVDIQFS